MKIKNYLLNIFLMGSTMSCTAMFQSSIGDEILQEKITEAFYTQKQNLVSGMGQFLGKYYNEYPYDFIGAIRSKWNHHNNTVNLPFLFQHFPQNLVNHFFDKHGLFKYPDQTFQEFITDADNIQKQPPSTEGKQKLSKKTICNNKTAQIISQTNVQTPSKKQKKSLPKTPSSTTIPVISRYIDPFSFGIGIGVGVVSMIILFQIYKKYKNKDVENITKEEPSKEGNSTRKNVSPIEVS